MGAAEGCRPRFPDAVEHREGVLAAVTTNPRRSDRCIRSMPSRSKSLSRSTKARATCRCFSRSWLCRSSTSTTLPEYLKEGSPFLRFIRETKVAVRDPHQLRRSEVGPGGRVATAQRRIEGSVSRLDLGRECWLRVGLRARGVEDHAVDVAARVARSAPAVLLERARAQVARDVSN